MASLTRGRTLVTLAVLAVVLVVMLVYGWNAASQPFPALGDQTESSCQNVKVKKRIFRKEITVSVYNATKRKGLADRTIRALERRHFRAGAVGNSPLEQAPRYVEVRTTTSSDDPAAQLVAAQFKPPAKIVVAEDDLGPGVSLVLGRKFKKLHVPSPRSLKLVPPTRTCLDKITADPNAGLGGA